MMKLSEKTKNFILYGVENKIERKEIPCCLDIPYLLSNNLVEVTGEVTQGAMSGENSNSERRIHIRDEKTGEEHSLKYWGTGSDLGDKITVRYLPHTEYGYVVE